MQVAVLCGGLGTRLQGALPQGIAKPMADVGGRPFLEFVLDEIVPQGATSFLMLVGYAASSISRHFGNSYRGVPVVYSREPKPMGTGGAVRNALALLEDEFVLINGDTYARLDYSTLVTYLASAPLAMGLAWTEDTGRFGAVEVHGGRVCSLGEKTGSGPGFINAGVYACTRGLIAKLESSIPQSFERDLLEREIARIRPRFVQAEDFIDIGVPADFSRAQTLFASADGGQDESDT